MEEEGSAKKNFGLGTEKILCQCFILDLKKTRPPTNVKFVHLFCIEIFLRNVSSHLKVVFYFHTLEFQPIKLFRLNKHIHLLTAWKAGE